MTAAMKVYIVQEVFSVLLATAAAVMALMLVPVAFVLLQSGAGHALSRLEISMRGWRMGPKTVRLRLHLTRTCWPLRSSDLGKLLKACRTMALRSIGNSIA